MDFASLVKGKESRLSVPNTAPKGDTVHRMSYARPSRRDHFRWRAKFDEMELSGQNGEGRWGYSGPEKSRVNAGSLAGWYWVF